MTDLLTPETVRGMRDGEYGPADLRQDFYRLCRNYITLWAERDKLSDIGDEVVRDWMFEKDRADKLQEELEG